MSIRPERRRRGSCSRTPWQCWKEVALFRLTQTPRRRLCTSPPPKATLKSSSEHLLAFWLLSYFGVTPGVRRFVFTAVSSPPHFPSLLIAPPPHVVLVRVLLQCGVDVDCRDIDGWTPLHAAAHWGQEEVCTLLADSMCDMAAVNNVVRATHTGFPRALTSLIEACVPAFNAPPPSIDVLVGTNTSRCCRREPRGHF